MLHAETFAPVFLNLHSPILLRFVKNLLRSVKKILMGFRFLPANKPSVYYEFLIPDGDESPNSLLSRCRRRATGADEVDVRNDDEVSEILFKFIEVKPGLMKGKTFVIRLYL
ncbi:hypothetical protein Tcan_04795 [Toxocara canis]|uniref:Uncharacterized protein n=1 Tax=Toxocara canis TaxID=6265 RepID=A0A0B2W6W1_TOXCA|nr:hypothetical protein Tcan_04795 [Toxocara canis]